MGPRGTIHAVFAVAKIPSGMAPAGTPADQRGVIYSYFDGCNWSSQLLEATGEDVFPAIALDAAGNPNVTMQLPVLDPATGMVASRDLWFLQPKP